MFISGQKKLRHLGNLLGHLGKGERFFLSSGPMEPNDLERFGFSPRLYLGEFLLPSASLGPVTRLNVEGKVELLKNEPKEKIVVQKLWHWREWGGGERQKIVDVQIERFKRHTEPPEEISVEIASDNNGRLVLVSGPFVNGEVDEKTVLHGVNLYLELFSRCHIRTRNKVAAVAKTKIVRNWHIYKGEPFIGWEEIEPLLLERISSLGESRGAVFKDRIKTIIESMPSGFAVGVQGFEGWHAFGFREKELVVVLQDPPTSDILFFRKPWHELPLVSMRNLILGESEDRLSLKDGWKDLFDRKVEGWHGGGT